MALANRGCSGQASSWITDCPTFAKPGPLADILHSMFIKEKYRIRHNLLGLFYDKYFEGNSPNADVYDTSLTFSQLEEISGLSTEKLIKTIDYLKEAEELYVEEMDYIDLYLITLKGRAAYHDEKYLYNGKKAFLNDTYDVIKTLSAIVLLVIAIITFIQNSIDIKKNKKEIESLKIEINQIKASKK
ncbi:MAG: hypothetical protein GXC72_01765 [Chitinophagaceae bacterium]|nr:hypothetical protein [Chitinophagaceae bacterium]